MPRSTRAPCDVVILGHGIAGGFLARQLKLTRPELDVVVLEASDAMTDYKVGESTVEVAAHYMIKRLRLAAYLYQHQLPKNGLRFFFDSKEKDLPLDAMSEIGSDHLPYHPSFQLERAALERDLVAMNVASGVDVLLGAKVVSVAIDAGASDGANASDGAGARRAHTIGYERGGEKHEIRARWVCDASGRRHLVPRALGNKVHKDTRLPTAASWARYRGVAGLDAVDNPEWRARVRWTSRHLSTNHLMYDGYWIWFIPLAGDLMSVGIVYDKDRIGEGPRTRAAFEAFLGEHRAARDLVNGAELVDFQSYAHLPYWSDQYFSRDGWALTGEAGAFTDPFYSPGSDFIATANELATALIVADLDGDPTFGERVDAYNAFYKFKYESTIRLYIGLYPTFGSFEVYRLKFLLDFNNYYNTVFWPFLADKLTDVAWIHEELRFGERVSKAQTIMADHFAKLAARLGERGDYHRQNRGQFSNGLLGVGQFERRLGPVLDAEFRKGELQRAYGDIFAEVLERMTDRPGLAARARVLGELDFPTVFVLKEITDATVERFLAKVGNRLTKDLQREFPDAGVKRVDIDGDAVRVVGPEGPHLATVESRAREMWNAPGASLAQQVG